MKHAYMTAGGAWAGHWYDGAQPPAAMIPAPAGGRFGVRWTGAEWVDDDTAEAEVEAVTRGRDPLADERGSMIADKWQIVAILDLMDPALWQRIEGYAAGTVAVEPLPPCDPVTRSAIRNAITIPRTSQIVDLLAYLLAWDADQVDALFRQAMELRG